MTFSAVRFAQARAEKGLTLGDVAKALGVSKPSVWAWEQGKAMPLPERVGDIAAALGVDPTRLFATPGDLEAASIRDALVAARYAINTALKLLK